DALNRDLPFDQFTIDQLAGDMLPHATLEQRIATGFHRNTMLNEEGGIDPLEFRFHAMTDRIATTGTVWLGLTVGCAQCHTHKFDPINHREYYQLLAFLNNADEPELEIARAEIVKQRQEIESKIREYVTALPAQSRKDFREGMERWYAGQEKTLVPWTTLRPAEATANVPRLTVQPDASILAS